MGHKPRIGSLKMLVIPAAVAQAEVAVHGSPHNVCIAVVLPIILPPADLAQLESLWNR